MRVPVARRAGTPVAERPPGAGSAPAGSGGPAPGAGPSPGAGPAGGLRPAAGPGQSGPAQSSKPRPPGPPPPPPPSLPGFFDRYWPAPEGPAYGWAIGTVAAAALTAAALLRVSRPGLGWLIFGLVVAGGVAGTVWRTPGHRRPADRLSAGRLLWGVAALALLAVGTMRAAGWLFVLCVLTAAVCGSIALAGGRTAQGLLAGALAAPAASLRGLPWLARGASTAATRTEGGAALRLFAATGVGVVLVLIFGGLFASADPAFAELVDDALPSVEATSVAGAITRFVIFGWGALGAVYLASRPPRLDRWPAGAIRPVNRFEWLVPVVLVDAVFAAFVAVQARTWFGGEQYVLKTAGLTFAAYARRGFWQLVVVSLLTLAVLAIAARKAPRATPTDRILLRAALGALCLLALVVVASSLARMVAYEQAYGLTRLRLLVAVCELWFGVVFLLVLAAGGSLRGNGPERGGWLPRAALGTGVAALLALAVLNPDRLIADRNIDRYERGGVLDVVYLSSLSADAAPEFDRLDTLKRACALERIADALKDDPDGWYEFNYGRWRARHLRPPDPAVRDCYWR